MHSAPITTVDQACIVITRDGSLSMKSDSMFNGSQVSKAIGAAEVINGHLFDLTQACYSNGTVRNRVNVAILDYGNGRVENAFSGPLAGKEFVSMTDLVAHPIRLERITPAAGQDRPVIERPVWVEPKGEGDTPMVAALSKAREIAQRWVDAHRAGFPPIIINVTDAESTDGDPASICEQIKALQSDDGPAVLFHVALTATGRTPIVFPATPDGLPDEFARALFDRSSILPDVMARRARELGIDVKPLARAFVCDAGLRDLSQALMVGSVMVNP